MEPEDRLYDSGGEPEAPKESSGEYLFRVLKPAGAVFVLLLGVMMVLFCFTQRGDPALDYTPLHASEWYAGHLNALETELRENLLPYLPECTLTQAGEVLEVRAAEGDLETVERVLTLHFDPELFAFLPLESPP